MTTPDPLGVQIGAREIYDKLNGVERQLSDVDRKVDRLVAGHDGLRADIADVRADIADHEARVRTLERGRWPLPSLAALVSIAALVVGLLGLLTKGG